MALVAPVENGKIVETASQTSVKKSTKSSKSGMDKEAFLQLLVAQMKYQDPLEPTSNRVHIPVCTVLTGRADAEYVQQHGLTESKLTGR